MHAMQQPATIATGTQLKLVSNIQLTRRSLAWPTVSAALIPSMVAPSSERPVYHALPAQRPMSSGNTKHLGTESNRFIDASGSEFILQQLSRPSGTPGAAEQYVHYLVNIKGPRS